MDEERGPDEDLIRTLLTLGLLVAPESETPCSAQALSDYRHGRLNTEQREAVERYLALDPEGIERLQAMARSEGVWQSVLSGPEPTLSAQMRELLADVLEPGVSAPRIGVIIGALEHARKALGQWVSPPAGSGSAPALPAGLLAPQLALATANGGLLDDSVQLAPHTGESAVYRFTYETAAFEMEVAPAEGGQSICLTVSGAAFPRPPTVSVVRGEEVIRTEDMEPVGAELVVTFGNVPDGCHLVIDTGTQGN